jgi:hypothetical protein
MFSLQWLAKVPIIAVLLFLAQTAQSPQVHNSWSLVQHVNVKCSSSPCSIAVDPIRPGHVGVIAIFNYEDEVTLSSISGAGTWVHPKECPAYARGSASTDLAYNLSTTGGTTLISVRISGTINDAYIEFLEYSFEASEASFDVCGSTAISGALNPRGVSLAPAGTNDVIVQIIASGSHASDISSPYKDPADFPGGYGIGGSINTTSGKAPTWTMSNSGYAESESAIAITEGHLATAAAPEWTPSISTLILAGIFLVVAVVLVLWLIKRRKA